uniref:Uncharacterized protein n=1 Tax=Picea glauca TaxID=3330 RepID=A0A101M4K9_PICGL|nr:hypothetical protein ABT39_MTgene636 [Picea glauca]
MMLVMGLLLGLDSGRLALGLYPGSCFYLCCYLCGWYLCLWLCSWVSIRN